MSRGIQPRALAELNDDRTSSVGTAGIPFLVTVQTSAGTASYKPYGDATPYSMRVIDAWCVATALGGASDTVTVGDGTTDITDAMDLNVADTTVVRAGTINDAVHDIAKGGTLEIATASGAVALVYVLCVRT